MCIYPAVFVSPHSVVHDSRRVQPSSPLRVHSRINLRRTNSKDPSQVNPLNIWHDCCYAEDERCGIEWFIPSKKGPLRALCLGLLDTIIVLLFLLLLTPVILFLPVIAIFWMLGICCAGDERCDPKDDAWEDDYEHGGRCCILAPCNKGFLGTVTVLLAWSLICPCPPGLATVVCLGLNLFCPDKCILYYLHGRMCACMH